MITPLALTLAGEAVELWPGRALHWPSGGALFLADPHFGKAAAFRAWGIAAPEGAASDLARLDILLERTRATQLVVLGDFFHARRGVSPETLDTLGRWRARHAGLTVTLVRGNHDRQAGDPPATLGIDCVGEPWPLGPWSCRHAPGTEPGAHVLAGHVHPGVLLRDRNGSRLRAACFVSEAGCTVLPAFGEFTGLKEIPRAPGRRRFAVTEEAVVEV
ncbi:MAG: ligase-associated damage response endonuclease PdeM [Verrucomicrobiota bacterium]|jgi:DNA ligase-associated metallophosphoesterase